MRRAPPLSSLFCHYYLHAVYKRAVTLPADNTQKATSADELSIQWSPHNTSIGGADLSKKGMGRAKGGVRKKKDGKKLQSTQVTDKLRQFALNTRRIYNRGPLET